MTRWSLPCIAWVVLAAGCTVVSEPNALTGDDAGADASAADGGSDRDAGGGAASSRERCATEQKLRCGTGRQREVCQAGYWVPTVECGDGEVCTDTSSGAHCVGVANVCRGNAGAAVCDGKGMLYVCGGDGVIQSMEACPSVRHCQLGLAARSCAACLPGELRCEGDMLQRCDPDGQAYGGSETCAAGSCDAAGGRCKGAPCPETRWRCRGDMLTKCQQGESEYRDAESCGPGLCDASAHACNRCVPGLSSCDGDVAVTCSADGATQTRVDCAAEASHCVGAGRCVRCGRDADCDDPGACLRAYCNLAQGSCEPQPRAAGSACPQGVCSEDGKCVSCVADTDCPTPSECEVRRCDPASHSCQPRPAAKGTTCGGGKCDGAGHCTACSADSDCPEAPACQTRHCDLSSGTCQPKPIAKGMKCSAGVCDGAGKCGGCNADADCPLAGACQARHCDVNGQVCEPQAVADGTTCNGAFGAGTCLAGSCVQCTRDAACPSSSVCQEGFCRTSDNTCQMRPKASGADCGGAKVCDGAGRCVECTAAEHCGDNATCLSNTCHCNNGFAPNPTGKGCNFDECAKFDDNRCGVAQGGNTCTNTASGYDCTCAAPWQKGQGQCFKSGTGRTVRNGSSWNVLPDFAVVCENAFDTKNPCSARGQLVWLNVCGLPDTTPGNCSGFSTYSEGLAGVTARKVDYNGPLEQYGQPPADGFTDHVDNVQQGNTILVQSLATLYIMRVTSIDSMSMVYDWAELFRDTCWRPGGTRCTAACNCPGGN
ncbi:MAG TPA: hypothetical protein VJR89_24840 [Polyangiales bacterium]|nr:hypothetical protein [Polyangiales bacterium]